MRLEKLIFFVCSFMLLLAMASNLIAMALVASLLLVAMPGAPN